MSKARRQKKFEVRRRLQPARVAAPPRRSQVPATPSSPAAPAQRQRRIATALVASAGLASYDDGAAAELCDNGNQT